MQYPILIENEPQMARLIRDIAKKVLADGPEKLKPIMFKYDLYREIGLRMGKRLIAEGKIPLYGDGKRQFIKRRDFNAWVNRNEL